MSPHMTFILYWAARTLLGGVRLGIFDQLTRGPQTAGQVAGALRLHPGATERLMRALTALGWLIQLGPLYQNSPISAQTLVKGSPVYAGGIADHHAEQLWPLWEHLETAVREGRSVVPEAFGGRDPFDLFLQSPEGVIKFLTGMQAGAIGYGELLSQAYDFTPHRHLADIGGGGGAVSAPIAHRYPHLRVTILELPPVAAVVPAFARQYRLEDRMAGQPGDFFRPETFPAGYDLALLGRVLHNWGDEQALAILRNIWATLPPGGVVLVVENLNGTGEPASEAFAALSDLTMLVMTGSGRERTAPEYEQMLRMAGFGQVATRSLGSSLAVIAGRK